MTTLDLTQLAEGKDVEAKLAVGRDGRGELPNSFFETYSAFANTEGGVVLLGIREKADHTLEVAGIVDVPKVTKVLWDSLNNRQRVSANLLTNAHVEEIAVAGKSVLRISVPRATRQIQPVYVGANPLSGTYRRGHEGDYRVPEETVRRMLAEQVDDARDGRVLEHFGIADLDAGTLARYRQRYQSRSPDHPFNQLDDREFLRSIGGWSRRRDTGADGLTVGGLLMFGKLVAIREELPNYMLDYQERAEPRTEARWVDRVTTDGSWSGNLYDFYQSIIQRLFRDLRVPFQLVGDTRIDETVVHEALREALVNTLIHADYSGRTSVLVVKRPDLFGFRNPGSMRMPVETALEGGYSDCRNRRLQDMFRYVGLGEQAGSGIPKIRAAWRQQHWRAPELVEQVEPFEQTIFTLRMASLLPADAVAGLERRLGDAFRQATEVQKLALVTAAVERSVTHARLRSMTDAHPRDVTVALASLVQRGLLETGGAHKRTYYHLPGEPPPAAEAFGFEPGSATPGPPTVTSSEHRVAVSSEHNGGASSEHSDVSSEHDVPGSERSDAEQAELAALAAPLRNTRRAPPETVRSVLLALCRGRFLTLPTLAALVGRSPDTIRVHYLTQLLAEGLITLRFPDQPTHPAQAYTTAER